MKTTCKKIILVLLSFSLTIAILLFTSCFSSNKNQDINNTLPTTIKVGKYTVNILDNVYINNSYTTTYVVESLDGDLNRFILFPRSLNDISTTGVYTYIKDIAPNKRYIVHSTIIDNKIIPDTLYLEFEAEDDSTRERKVATIGPYTFEKNSINNFDNVQAREISQVTKVSYGEIYFYKALYSEEYLTVFANFIGTNSPFVDILSRSEVENYYFTINNLSERYELVSSTSIQKKSDFFLATSPQIVGYDDNISWIKFCTIKIPVHTLPEEEYLTLNIYEKDSHKLLDAITLENIRTVPYSD